MEESDPTGKRDRKVNRVQVAVKHGCQLIELMSWGGGVLRTIDEELPSKEEEKTAKEVQILLEPNNRSIL